jgi:hypothetical protein
MQMGEIGCNVGCMLKTGAIQITPELLSLNTRIDEFKGAWRALGTLAPERLSVLRSVATIERVQLFSCRSPLFALRLTQLAKISILRTFKGRCVHGVAPPPYATTRTAKEHFLVVPVVVYNLL